jgi:HEAT repeat protein
MMVTTRTPFGAMAVLLAGLGAGAAAQTPAEWQDVILNLRHPNADTRLSAVNRLGGAAYTPAAEPLAALITDPDDRVQVAAIEAELSLFQSDRIGGLPGGSKSRAQEAFEAGQLYRAAASVPALVIDRLIAAIRDENARVRFDAVHAIGFLAEAPFTGAQVRLLAAELDHYDPIIRAAAARVLGRLKATEAADALAIALTDSNSVVRLYATEALGVIRDRKAAVELRTQLSRSRGDLLEFTFLALARIGEADDRELFRARTGDRSEAMRRAALEGLGRTGDRDSIDAIERALKTDRSDSVRTAAAFALVMLGRPEATVITANLAVSGLTAQARDYVLEIGRATVPAIEATLKVATDSRHRAHLIQLIGYVGTIDQVATLEPMAADRDERVRRAVAQAIARLRRGAVAAEGPQRGAHGFQEPLTAG